MNTVLSIALLSIAALTSASAFQARTSTDRTYFTWLLLLSLLVGIQSTLQAAFLNLNVTLDFHFFGTVLTGLLLLGYGWFVPGLGGASDFFRVLTVITRTLMILSFVVLFLRPDLAFKGTRFIGTFKHIPYMVTCAQIALMVETGNLVTAGEKWAEKLRAFAFLLLATAAILLTGTRSATLAAIAFLALAYWKSPALSERSAWIRQASGYLAVVFVLTLGPFVYQELESFLRGQSAFALRTAQDGISSRFEEIERGWASFTKEPWLGHGLLFRFGSQALDEAFSYNSFRDPHNIFVSAGVIGGWPMLVFVGIGVLVLSWSYFRELMRPVRSMVEFQHALIVAFMVSVIPILVVYHMHFSLGGLADRMYWLFIGGAFRWRKEG